MESGFQFRAVKITTNENIDAEANKRKLEQGVGEQSDVFVAKLKATMLYLKSGERGS